MTMNVRQELCAVMVFAVVEKAGSTVMEDKEEVCQIYLKLMNKLQFNYVDKFFKLLSKEIRRLRLLRLVIG